MHSHSCLIICPKQNLEKIWRECGENSRSYEAVRTVPFYWKTPKLASSFLHSGILKSATNSSCRLSNQFCCLHVNTRRGTSTWVFHILHSVRADAVQIVTIKILYMKCRIEKYLSARKSLRSSSGYNILTSSLGSSTVYKNGKSHSSAKTLDIFFLSSFIIAHYAKYRVQTQWSRRGPKCP